MKLGTERKRERGRETERESTVFPPSHREPVYQNEQMVDLAGARMAHPQEGTNATTLTLHKSLSPPLSDTVPLSCSILLLTKWIQGPERVLTSRREADRRRQPDPESEDGFNDTTRRISRFNLRLSESHMSSQANLGLIMLI